MKGVREAHCQDDLLMRRDIYDIGVSFFEDGEGSFKLILKIF